MQLTEHFSLAELCDSPTAVRLAIPNDPSAAIYPNLMRLAVGMERVRAMVGAPILVLSGFRSPALNAAVGGVKNSAHMDGMAADIRVQGMAPRDLAELLAGNPMGIDFDQLILEQPGSPAGGWVHVGFGYRPRHEILTARGRPVKYQPGIAA